MPSRLHAALVAVGASIAASVSAHVAKAAGGDEVDDADWSAVRQAVGSSLEKVAVSAAEESAKVLASEGVHFATDTSTEQVYERARDWAKRRSAELVGKRLGARGELVDDPDAQMAITDTVRDEVRSEVAQALADGLPAKELAQRIERLGCFSEDRAETIARTEIIRANNAGHLESFRAAGIPQKGWSTAGEDVCDECQSNEDEGAVDLDSSFTSGDDAPPAHPNCRCVIVALLEPESDETTDEDEAAQ